MLVWVKAEKSPNLAARSAVLIWPDSQRIQQDGQNIYTLKIRFSVVQIFICRKIHIRVVRQFNVSLGSFFSFLYKFIRTS